jgi:hypothetical protein
LGRGSGLHDPGRESHLWQHRHASIGLPTRALRGNFWNDLVIAFHRNFLGQPHWRTSIAKWLSAPFREDGFVGLINISRTTRAKRFISSTSADRTKHLSSAAAKRHLHRFPQRRRSTGGRTTPNAAGSDECRASAQIRPRSSPTTNSPRQSAASLRQSISAVAQDRATPSPSCVHLNLPLNGHTFTYRGRRDWPNAHDRSQVCSIVVVTMRGCRQSRSMLVKAAPVAGQLFDQMHHAQRADGGRCCHPSRCLFERTREHVPLQWPMTFDDQSHYGHTCRTNQKRDDGRNGAPENYGRFGNSAAARGWGGLCESHVPDARCIRDGLRAIWDCRLEP